MSNINPVHKLALFYIEDVKVGEQLKQAFWNYNYGFSSNEIIPILYKHKLISEKQNLQASIHRMKVAELKQVLRDNGLKLSGNKDELINRIIENKEKVEISNLPKFYTLTDKGSALKDSSEYLLYFHKSIFNYDIFEIEKLKNVYPELSSEKFIEHVLIKEMKEDFERNQYSVASISSENLYNFYEDIGKDEETLLNQILITVSLKIKDFIYRYENYNIHLDDDYYFETTLSHNTNLITRLKGIFYKKNYNNEELITIISNSIRPISESLNEAKLISSFMIILLNNDKKSFTTLLNKLTPSKSYRFDNQLTVKFEEQQKKSSGCLIYIALPIAIPTILTFF